VNGSTAGGSGPIVVAGAGYAGLHVALRLTARLRHRPQIELTLVDRHDYHQAVTELPRVAADTPRGCGQPDHTCEDAVQPCTHLVHGGGGYQDPPPPPPPPPPE
jgi:nucleoside-diphosphate-sugar epimerase